MPPKASAGATSSVLGRRVRLLPAWTVALPLLGAAMLLLPLVAPGVLGGPLLLTIDAVLLAGCVFAAVHHAEVVAHRVGEPFGTLVLAIAVTVIEVALIVSLMLSDDSGGASTLARDTVFAAIMIILNGIVGLCLLVGGARHREQRFTLPGVSASLAVLAAITVLTLVLPNYTTSVAGPFYSPTQLVFVALLALVLYATFLLVQTVRHRSYFLPEDEGSAAAVAERPPGNVAGIAFGLLLVALVAVVLLAKALAPIVERTVREAGLPLALVGVVIAALVLAPESVAAVRAARRNRLQTSLNLALGSALATIGLTIPAVAGVSLLLGLDLTLGIDAKGMTLLALSLFVASLSLGTGRTTVLQGAVHLVLFATYLFVTIEP